MNYNLLLDVATEIGYNLAMCGAETFRIEESICRILRAYNINAEAFAIPNCLTVSIITNDNTSITKMRRIGSHGNDLDSVDKFNNLSRKICVETPEPETALQWLRETKASVRRYNLPLYLLGNLLGGGGFCVIFGGSVVDCLCAALCGLVIGLLNHFMDKMRINLFFQIIVSAFSAAAVAYVMSHIGICPNADATIIGALMILVPGLLFTNALRDIIYGDTNSGLNRIVQVFLIAAAIALGTGSALSLITGLGGIVQSAEAIYHPLIWECVASYIGGLGFTIVFNIYGHNAVWCGLGSMLTWLTFSTLQEIRLDGLACYFWASVLASIYAEILARKRKSPAISYLVISIFPLIPGAGVYYTMMHIVKSDMGSFLSKGIHTLAVASIIAVGILLGTTVIRFIFKGINHRKIINP